MHDETERVQCVNVRDFMFLKASCPCGATRLVCSSRDGPAVPETSCTQETCLLSVSFEPRETLHHRSYMDVPRLPGPDDVCVQH